MEYYRLQHYSSKPTHSRKLAPDGDRAYWDGRLCRSLFVEKVLNFATEAGQ
jgi:hypothetical protein